MLRTEMIDNLLDSYTMRELKALAKRLDISTNDYDYSLMDMLCLADSIHDILFDPGGWHEDFKKLAEMEK